MRDMLVIEKIQNLMMPFLKRGFVLEYFYERGEDGANVYVCRFKKGKEYFDWREKGREIVVDIQGKEGRTLHLKKQFPKAFRKFFFQHLFKKATMDEYRALVAGALVEELQNPEFFGIKL